MTEATSTLIIQHYLSGLSIPDIAEKLGLNTADVLKIVDVNAEAINEVIKSSLPSSVQGEVTDSVYDNMKLLQKHWDNENYSDEKIDVLTRKAYVSLLSYVTQHPAPDKQKVSALNGILGFLGRQ